MVAVVVVAIVVAVAVIITACLAGRRCDRDVSKPHVSRVRIRRAAWARGLVGVWPRARSQARAFGPADLSFGTSRFASAVVAISWRISDDDSNYHHHHNDDNNNNDDDDDDITNARQIVEMLQGKLVLTGGARTQVARASQYNLPDSLHRQGRSRIAVARRRPQAMRSSLRSRRSAVVSLRSRRSAKPLCNRPLCGRLRLPQSRVRAARERGAPAPPRRSGPRGLAPSWEAIVGGPQGRAGIRVVSGPRARPTRSAALRAGAGRASRV